MQHIDYKKWLKALVLLLATMAAYSPALQGGFVWDDSTWTVDNRALYESGDSLWRIWTVPATLQQYYPLTGASFWLDHHLWGHWPLPYHVENILLHSLSALLFWWLLVRLNVRGAGLACMIFALHPAMVESVGWITERKNTLSLVLTLAALLTYGFSVQWWKEPERRQDGKLYLIALFLFVAALAAKITAFVLPPVALLLGWWKLGTVRLKRDLLPLAPFFVLAIGFSVGVSWLERHHIGAEGADWNFNPMERVLIAGRACFFYLGGFFWPQGNSFLYPRWVPDTSSLAQWLYPICLLAVILVGFFARRYISRGVVVAVFGFLGPLIPVLGFMNVYGMRFSFVADRWVYFSALSLSAVAAAAAVQVHRRWRNPAALYVTVGLLLCVLARLTWGHANDLRNEETFWRSVISRDSRSWLAHDQLGIELGKSGRIDEAVQSFRTSVELNPGYGNAHVNLGIALLKSGQIGEAISELKTAAEMSSEDALIHLALGNALCTGQRLPEGIAEYQRAIDLDPSSFTMHERLGAALVQAGRIDEAIAHFIKLQEQWPKEPEPNSFLGNVFFQTGRNREAVEQYERALQRSPSNLVALNNLSLVLSSGSDVSTRDPARALVLAQRLNDMTGANESTYVSTLAAAYVASGHIAEASEAAEKAAQLASEKGLISVAASLHQRALALKRQMADDSK